jgi:hypothetical protein
MSIHSMLCRALLASCCLAGSTTAGASAITALELQGPDGDRHVLLAVPDRIAPGKHPLVILLHGHAGSAEQILGHGRGAAPLSVWPCRVFQVRPLWRQSPMGARRSFGAQHNSTPRQHLPRTERRGPAQRRESKSDGATGFF